MKKTIVFIIIMLLLIVACMYYNCMQQEKCEQDKQAAVAAAVQNTIDSLDAREALEIPPQQTVAHRPPPPPEPEVKTLPEPEVAEDNTFLDERDGQQYKMFNFNGQWWMGQNLNFETPDSWCYDLDDAKCADFGRIYTWDAAMQACPDGWHLPGDEEWKALLDYYGGNHYAGKNLKEGGASDFNAVMSGYRDKAGFFGKIGESAYFWSSTEENKDYASFKGLYLSVDNVGTYTYTKPDGLSVRCVKD